MPSASFTQHIKHNADELLELVANVEEYPSFIDLISSLRITKQLNETDFEAEVVAAYKTIRQDFKSLVQVDREKKLIRVTKAEKGGPIKNLENRWAFHALPDGTTLVDFYVDVTLKAFPLNLLIKDKFERASQHIMKVFEMRAAEVCKPVKADPKLNLAEQKELLGLV